MKYGEFDLKNKEYIINSVDTPLPWINYLTNGELFSLISNYGGGYSFYKDAKLRRITRFTYNSPTRDNNGRMLYINDGEEIFSPCFYPSKTPLDFYSCHVGLNYTRFVSKKNNISMDLLCFIPQDMNVEINKLVIKNDSEQTKNLVITSAIEFCLWNAMDDMTNFQRNFSTGEVEIENNVIYHKTEYRERRNHYAFYATNDSDTYETDRDTFLGKHHDYNAPIEVINNQLSNKICSGWSPIGAFQKKITLKPNEEITLIYLLGYVENKEEEKFIAPNIINKVHAYEIIDKYLNVSNIDKAFNNLKEQWDLTLSTYQIKSSDERLDTMVNVFNQYQCMMTYYLSRSASYYESGIGRGMGFRDSCQDLLGFVHLKPELARQRILDIASIMKIDGSTWHQYQPLDKKGNADIGGGFNDDSLWLIAATYAYLAETGDYSVLNEKIAYNSSDTLNGSLLEHLEHAYQYTLDHLGPHGLPLIGHADWNDCLNLNCFSKEPGQSFQCFEGKDTGVAESIFIAAMFVKYGQEYSEILRHINKPYETAVEQVNKMREAIYQYGYDVDHFLRAYDAFGHKVGSYENKEGQVYIEPQGMCVMAHLGLENGLASKALKTVDEKLNSKYGICLLTPCYSQYHLELGEITSYPQGYKENGGIFCHNNPWIMIAECINNNPEKAFEYYQKITPSYIQDISDIHKTEPYVYSQMIAGQEAINFGEAKNSWLTGTSAWTFVAVSQYILGVRPTLDGLLIEPKLPKDINNVCVVRKFKGHTIHINMQNKNAFKLLTNDEINKGEENIYVNL